MKRAVATSAALCLLFAAAASADAAPKRKPGPRRTVTVNYAAPSAYYSVCVDCPEVRARSNEHYVTVEVLDRASPSGHVDIAWETSDGDGTGDDYFVVCGKTKAPRKIPAGKALTVYPWAHPAPECPTSFSTSGQVKITFSGTP